MRLLFAIKSLNVAGGGAERVLVQVANALALRGHEISILTFDPPGASFYPLLAGINRIDLALGHPGQPTPRAALVRALPRIRKAVLGNDPDLVVGFMHSMYVPIALSLVGSKTRVLASEHAVPRHFDGRKLERALVGLVRRLVVGTTVPSQAALDAQPATWKKSAFVLPNPVSDVGASADVGKGPAYPPVLLCVGRFMAEKGHEVLLEAFDRAARRFPDWKLRLVGEGELRPRLESLVSRMECGDRVEMPGATKQIAQEYANAELVVVPSYFESFGMVALESQACGRAVIGFEDCAGNQELISHGINGWLIADQGDRVAALAAGLEQLMADGSLRAKLAAGGPASADRFSAEKVAAEWERKLSQFVLPASR